MASLGTTFDSTEHDTEQRDFTPLPDGDYELEVIESDVVPTKAGNGTILKLTYSVIQPSEFKDRKIWANINVENANQTAQQIGQRELASLCRAIGIARIEDSEELHFKAFAAKVGLEKKREGYNQRNEIKRFYFPDEGAVPQAKVAGPANDNQRPSANDNRPSAQPAQVSGGSRPWGRK